LSPPEAEERDPAGAATSYDAYYFAHGCGRPYRRDPEWLALFQRIAQRIHPDIAPATVLDAGCAFGFLVEALRDLGIKADGIDVSPYAIGQVAPDTQPHCRVASVTEPLGRRYDLIVCIEVVEHLDIEACDAAIANFAAHSDDVLFSSTPSDFKEASHVSVRPPDYWAERFAAQGLFRDVDFDAGFITPWAARFRRTGDPAHRVVAAYERRLWRLEQQARAQGELARELRAELARHHGEQASAGAADQGRLEAAEAEVRSWRGRWADLEASPGWRLLTRLQHIRGRLAPPGSRRDRCLDRLLVPDRSEEC